MGSSRIAERYAKSLIELAQEQGKLDRIMSDVEHFLSATKVRDFALLLKSPIVNSLKKAAIFKALFGDKFDEMTFTFLNIVLRKGREINLPDIATEFVSQYNKINQISEVTVRTATELTDDQLSQLKAKIKESGLTLENIDLHTKIDPSILGGFIIEIGDNRYDASVKHKLEEMRKAFS